MFPAIDLTREGKELHLREWKLILCDVGPEQFDAALTEHIRESKFFPTVAELRERAGLKKADQEAVETNAQWEFALYYASHYYHPDLGHARNAPKIPPRTEYAVRQLGGWQRLNRYAIDSLPFTKKDFVEAYRIAPVAAANGQLSEAEVFQRILLEAGKRKLRSEQTPEPQGNEQ